MTPNGPTMMYSGRQLNIFCDRPLPSTLHLAHIEQRAALSFCLPLVYTPPVNVSHTEPVAAMTGALFPREWSDLTAAESAVLCEVMAAQCEPLSGYLQQQSDPGSNSERSADSPLPVSEDDSSGPTAPPDPEWTEERFRVDRKKLEIMLLGKTVLSMTTTRVQRVWKKQTNTLQVQLKVYYSRCTVAVSNCFI